MVGGKSRNPEEVVEESAKRKLSEEVVVKTMTFDTCLLISFNLFKVSC